MNPEQLTQLEERGYILVFDLDGTLYPEEFFLKDVFGRISKLFKGKEKTVYEYLCISFLQEGRENLLEKLLNLYPDHNLSLSDLLAIYRNFESKLTCYDWFYKYRAITKSRELYIITNGNVQQQKSKVKALGLSETATVVYANSLAPKPSPESYDQLKLKACKNNVVYIGDTASDFIFSKNVGIKFLHTRHLLTNIE